MPLENASTISQLDANWPLGLDSASRGDDHLRLLKAVLKAQFPGSNGQGFSKAITASEDDLNSLPSKVANMALTLFPVGSVVLRLDATNPANIYGGSWQLITGDATLSLGDGSAQSGSISGNNNPLVPVQYHTHSSTHDLVAGPGGDHTHGGVPARTRVEIGGGTRTLYSVYADGQTYSSGPHQHGISGSVNIGASGTENATIDVRGARVSVNVWKRVS